MFRDCQGGESKRPLLLLPVVVAFWVVEGRKKRGYPLLPVLGVRGGDDKKGCFTMEAAAAAAAVAAEPLLSRP